MADFDVLSDEYELVALRLLRRSDVTLERRPKGLEFKADQDGDEDPPDASSSPERSMWRRPGAPIKASPSRAVFHSLAATTLRK